MTDTNLVLLNSTHSVVLPSLSWHLVIRGTSTLSRGDLRRRGARARDYEDRLRNAGGLFPNLLCTAFAWLHEWPFCRSGSGLLCVTDTPLFKGQLNAAMLAEKLPVWLEVFATDDQGRVAMGSVSHENMYWVRGSFLVAPQRTAVEAPRWKMADHELLDPESTQLLLIGSGQAAP